VSAGFVLLIRHASKENIIEATKGPFGSSMARWRFIASTCSASVRQIEIQQPRAVILGLERSMLTFRSLPQTPLRLFVHDAETMGGLTLFL